MCCEYDYLAKIGTKEVSSACMSLVKVGTVHILAIKVSTVCMLAVKQKVCTVCMLAVKLKVRTVCMLAVKVSTVYMFAVCETCRHTAGSHHCQFCERTVCQGCLRQCDTCGDHFCQLCSTLK